MAQLFGFGGNGALPRQQQRIRHFSEDDAQSEAGRREQCRSMKGAPERPRELTVAYRRRSGGVDWPTGRWCSENEPYQIDPVLEMDPRPVLLSGSYGSTRAEPEWRQHLRQRAAIAVEHDARPDARDTR